MGFHTFDAGKADRLEDAANRYRWLSREELLYALDPVDGDVIADLGSGTGFYTDDVAPRAGTVYAVDVQEAMHDAYREKGVPANVECVTSDVADLPFATDALDGVFSTMTYHEFASDAAIDEVARVLRPGARAVIADWSADGSGESGPPTDERYAAVDAVDALERGGFEVVSEATRPETFVVVARLR
ncbi:methyltransferase domain-containing protein [Halorubrum sp. JWXQ-INN 858]|uniref:class I SAM-dependent methyltransferase n=1 Tax=Halorubrum sp. JWXQ-INN 858 TaxID=2690782 RepID=UPI001356A221|nr:class I SAM-dependent methyltransferase [Halorubrum sp. JWXQ-INN 858]MWV65410.1 methyltransferase domain-containing protein [Halorubrum sp. JWXQ-INN 858]